MSKITDMKKELQELRENTLNEFKEFEPTDFDSDAKENWAKRNEDMADLVDKIKQAEKIQKEQKEI